MRFVTLFDVVFFVTISHNEVIMKKLNEVYTGRVFGTSNYGDIKVLEYFTCMDVLVRFVDTGYEVSTRVEKIKSGSLRDPMSKVYFGVGYIGFGEYKASRLGKKSKAVVCWVNMISRCYNKNNKSFINYKDCTVCDEWHNFQNFADWYYKNHPENSNEYQLDKDIKQKGVTRKVYSPITCLFVTQDDNAEEAHAKHYSLLSPSGYVVEVYNLRKFSLKNNLCDKNMSAVALGKRKSHKGWSLNHG